MTESKDQKKRGKKKEDPRVEPPDVRDVEEPGSDPTLSDRDAEARDAKGPPSSEDPTYDMPVSGFFDGERPMNESANETDIEMTVNLTGDMLSQLPGRDDLEEPTYVGSSNEDLGESALERARFQQRHLRGALEALIFASEAPMKANELAKRASAPLKEVKEQLLSLKSEYQQRGIQLDEVAGGWVFRTSPEFAPFVRELSKQKPVRLTRAQLETLAILAYRQPITRPEIDDIRGVDSGPVLKLLLERDLIRILGKKDEAGRPILYGTTAQFLEFFGLKGLKDLPTLKEFTELNEDSRRVVEEELGESLETIQEEILKKEQVGLDVTREIDLAETEAAAKASATADEGESHTVQMSAPVAGSNPRDTFTNEHLQDEGQEDAHDAQPPINADDEAEFPDDDDSDFDDDDEDDDEDEDENDDDEEAE